MNKDPLFLVKCHITKQNVIYKLQVTDSFLMASIKLGTLLFSFPILCSIHPPYKTNISGLAHAIHFKKNLSPPPTLKILKLTLMTITIITSSLSISYRSFPLNMVSRFKNAISLYPIICLSKSILRKKSFVVLIKMLAFFLTLLP